MPIRVCFIVSEIFAFGRYGGFGKLVRDLGSELLKRGVEVCAVTWRGEGQREIEHLDGISVYSFPYNPTSSISSHLFSYISSAPLYKMADADVYVSVELQVSTYVAQKVMPDRKHVVWFQDPYDEEAYKDMALVDRNYAWNLKRRLQFYATGSLIKQVCRKADLLLTQARMFIPIVKRLYKVNKEIYFMPNPVRIPDRNIKKALEPTVCFIGRWDPQKRVEIFLELARKFPEMKFIATGKGYNEAKDKFLRKRYRGVKNLETPGFVTEEEKSRILERSWILINTSIREGLPISFLEACAHKTAILSYVNPDNFARKFGYYSKENDFEVALSKLLKNDLWKDKGKAGYECVRKFHNINTVTEHFYNKITNRC